MTSLTRLQELAGISEKNQINESSKVTKKNVDSIVKLANDSSIDLDEFIQQFSDVYNSAAEMWMDKNKCMKLRNQIKLGKQVLSLTLDPTTKTFAASVAKATKNGWIVFDEEESNDAYEAIFLK